MTTNEEPNNKIVLYNPGSITPSAWTMLERMALIFADDSVRPKMFKNKAHMLSAMAVAFELGLPTTTPLRGKLFVTNGLVTCDGQLMVALATRSGEVQLNITENTAEDWVEVKASRPAMGLEVTARWDAERVRVSRANMSSEGEKITWKQHRHTMMRWRAITEALRVVAANEVLGLYTPDEVDQLNTIATDADVDGTARELPEVDEAMLAHLTADSLSKLENRLAGLGFNGDAVDKMVEDVFGADVHRDALNVLQAQILYSYATHMASLLAYGAGDDDVDMAVTVAREAYAAGNPRPYFPARQESGADGNTDS